MSAITPRMIKRIPAAFIAKLSSEVLSDQRQSVADLLYSNVV
jgi:hypothetical protein